MGLVKALNRETGHVLGSQLEPVHSDRIYGEYGLEDAVEVGEVLEDEHDLEDQAED